MADLLTAQSLRKEFGGLTAVNDVDFTVPEGKIVSLIGPNGAGKTTFFNMLTGVYKPTDGLIILIVMLLRPEGLIPSRRRAAELHEGVHDEPLYDHAQAGSEL